MMDSASLIIVQQNKKSQQRHQVRADAHHCLVRVRCTKPRRVDEEMKGNRSKLIYKKEEKKRKFLLACLPVAHI
jgi:hypothetical protein